MPVAYKCFQTHLNLVPTLKRRTILLVIWRTSYAWLNLEDNIEVVKGFMDIAWKHPMLETRTSDSGRNDKLNHPPYFFSFKYVIIICSKSTFQSQFYTMEVCVFLQNIVCDKQWQASH